MTAIRQWLCGLTGHEELLKFHQGRMHLWCSCGWESPGWADCAQSDVARAAAEGAADREAAAEGHARRAGAEDCVILRELWIQFCITLLHKIFPLNVKVDGDDGHTMIVILCEDRETWERTFTVGPRYHVSSEETTLH